MTLKFRSIWVASIIPLTSLFILFLAPIVKAAEINVYRIYNQKSGEHLYTTNQDEVQALCQGDWRDEGIGWKSPDSGSPVYRLYNPVLADHLYSTDENEVTTLTTEWGWSKDFNGQPLFYSGGTIPVYRLYNSISARHHLTVDENENNQLPETDWFQGGPKLWASSKADDTSSPQISTLTLKLELNNGSPDDEYIGIFNREWTLGKGGDVHLLDRGVPLQFVTSNSAGEILIPNDLEAGHYVISREYTTYDFNLLEIGEFDLSPEEVGQTIVKPASMDYIF